VGEIPFLIYLEKFFDIFLFRSSTMDIKKMTSREGRAGHYLTPIMMYIIRYTVSLIAGVLLALVFSVVDNWSDLNLMGIGWWLLFGLVMAGFFSSADEPAISVPVNHVGILTFLGGRMKIYLEEGDYPWYGKKLLFGISTTPLGNAKNVTEGPGEEQGFVYIGKRVISIWNDKDSKRATIDLPSRTASNVGVKLTLEIITTNPIVWASIDDPVLEIAEQARSGLRKTIGFFRDTDVKGAKAAITTILAGDSVITAFINKKVGSLLPWTMVQDHSGMPMYGTLSFESGLDSVVRNQRIEAAKTAFRQKLKVDGLREMIGAVGVDQSGEIQVAELSISEKLQSIVAGTGSIMADVIMSDTQVSDTVRKAAEAAASEGAQRDQQITSAETQVEVMNKLARARQDNGGIDELDRILAAAADGTSNIHVNHVTGTDNPIVKAATIHSQQSKGKG
jgi:hypothetical protein